MFESLELILPPDAALPPGGDEARAITGELYESRRDAQQADTQAAVADSGIDKQQQAQGEDGQPRKGAHQIPAVEMGRVVVHQRTPHSRDEDEGGRAHGEHRRQHVDQFQRRGVFLVEVDAGDAAVIDLAEELAEGGAALVPHPGLGKQTAAAITNRP